MEATQQLSNNTSLSLASNNSIILDFVQLPQMQSFSSSSFPCPQLSPSPLPSPQLSPSPIPVTLPPFMPALSASASTSLSFMPMQPSLSPTPEWLVLNQFVGDWVAVAHSKFPGKYDSNKVDASSSTKRIVFSQGIYRVLFSKYAGLEQDYQIRIASNARVQLFSPSQPTYSFFLLPNSPIGTMTWENEFDPTHIVTWRQIVQVLPMEHFFAPLSDESSLDSEATGSTVPTLPMFVYSCNSNESCFRRNSNMSDPELPFPTSCHFDFPELDQPRSRRNSFESQRSLSVASMREDLSLPLKVNDRDSKQNLVNEVEPRVDELIEGFYALPEEYRPNQSGRVGPPVLRGDDVLFIPAKKQAALENVVEFLKLIKQNTTILAAAKVCQKKKKRQKKGFLIYLKLQSAEEVSHILREYYPQFESSIQGVKTAIFAGPKSTNV